MITTIERATRDVQSPIVRSFGGLECTEALSRVEVQLWAALLAPGGAILVAHLGPLTDYTSAASASTW